MRKNQLARRQNLRVSQNFLTSAAVVRRLLRLTNIGRSDHVVEIGPGKGHITKQLLARCGRLTAVELDERLHRRLTETLGPSEHLRLVRADFLRWPLPCTPYKVFANIPFHRTTDIVRRLTGGPNPPSEMWLVVEKGAAKRFLGQPEESLLSLQLKPFWRGDIRYHFRREDFHPAPSVDTVLLHLSRRTEPDLPPAERQAWRRFLSTCLAKGGPGVRALLTKKQIARALRELSCDIPSADTLYIQWLCLFRCYLRHGAPRNR